MIYSIVLIFLACSRVEAFGKLNVLYEWKYVDFAWKNPSQKANAIDGGNYNITSCIPYDVDQAPDGRIFVTVVRGAGVPATLTTITGKIGDGGPLLEPYPNWSWNEANDCEGLIGVYRVTIARNKLYVLDTGNNGEKQICPAKLLIFDLMTDRLIDCVIIPSKYSTNENGTGLLVTPVVDVVGPYNVHVYMADTEGYGLVMWDGNSLTRIESKYFEAESDATHFTVGDDSFDLADGILGMAIARDRFNEYKSILYFRPLASFFMYHVETEQLRNLRNDQSAIRYGREENRMRSQSAAQAFSRNGILFFSSLTDRSLVCWNRRKIFNDTNTVQFAVNEETLQFPSGVKVVGKGRREKLLVMTNRYQQVANNDMNFTDVNFRIHGGTVGNIVRRTNCE